MGESEVQPAVDTLDFLASNLPCVAAPGSMRLVAILLLLKSLCVIGLTLLRFLQSTESWGLLNYSCERSRPATLLETRHHFPSLGIVSLAPP